MNCPTCSTAGAYVGLRVVECTNTQCIHYSPSNTTAVRDTLLFPQTGSKTVIDFFDQYGRKVMASVYKLFIQHNPDMSSSWPASWTLKWERRNTEISWKLVTPLCIWSVTAKDDIFD